MRKQRTFFSRLIDYSLCFLLPAPRLPASLDYNEAIRLKPNYAEAFYFRGMAYHVEGNMDKAMEDYTEAIRLKANYAEAYYCRSLVRRARGDMEGAARDHSEAVCLGYPDN